MKITLNLRNLIAAFAASIVACLIVNGTAQSVIHFSDPINEVVCFFMVSMLGITSLFTAFGK